MDFELEVCVDRLAPALAAIEAGATRIEYNAALTLDGLTPSPSSCRWLVEHCPVPIIAMLRPHHLNFCYTSAERKCLLADCQALLETGIHGIACGALTPQGELDDAFLRDLVRLCNPVPVVLHRAFDCLPNPVEALPRVIETGVARILTSGAADSALQGVETLRRLQQEAAGAVEILPAAGIQSDNALQILEATGCNQLHGSFRQGGDEVQVEEIHRTRRILEAFAARA